jgi:hypothetical protein
VGRNVGDVSEQNAAENPEDDCSDARGGQCKVGGTILLRNPFFISSILTDRRQSKNGVSLDVQKLLRSKLVT